MAPAEDQAVDTLMPTGRKSIRQEAIGENGLSFLLRRQVAGKFQAETLFVLECDDSRIFSGIRVSRLSPHEGRRQRHLLTQDEASDNQMMTAYLPSPRFGRGRLTENVQLVGPLAKQVRRADEFAEKRVEF